MEWLDRLVDFWPHIVGFLTLFIAVLTSGHAILHKRDSRAAALWVLFIWTVPLVGPVFYLMLGINRIRRWAISLREAAEEFPDAADAPGAEPTAAKHAVPLPAAHLRTMAELVGRVVGRPLLP